MSALQQRSPLTKCSFVIGGALALLTTFFLVWQDFNLADKVLEYTDFRNSFYIAGLLVQHGRSGDLYPKVGDAWFNNTAFDVFAHSQLPDVKATESCNFLYPPLVASLFLPLSWLAPRIAQLVWQLSSMACLALAAFLFCRAAPVRAKPVEILAVSFLSFPLLHVLIIGQLAVFFGILPVVLGYLLYRRRQFVGAGIAWAMVSVKLQLFFPLACIVASKLIAAGITGAGSSRKKDALFEALKLVEGMALGVVLFQILPLAFFGTEAFAGWVRAILLVSKCVATTSQTWAQHTIVSVPGAVIFLCPAAWSDSVRLISTLFSVVFAVLYLAILTRIWLVVRSDSNKQIDAILLVAFFCLPFISPYMRFYDYSILLVPTWLAFFRATEIDALTRATRLSLLVVWVSLDAYWLFLWIIGKPPADAVVWPLTAVAAASIYAIWKAVRIDDFQVIE